MFHASQNTECLTGSAFPVLHKAYLFEKLLALYIPADTSVLELNLATLISPE